MMLFLVALRLSSRVQRVRSMPLPRVVAALNRRPPLAATGDPRQAQVAAARACGRIGRWFGGLDTCLTRSLVAGILLAPRADVVLHVGFRPGKDDEIDGHAWLAVNGEEVQITMPPGLDQAPYTTTLELALGAPGES
jgi:hypothetical protein